MRRSSIQVIAVVIGLETSPTERSSPCSCSSCARVAASRCSAQRFTDAEQGAASPGTESLEPIVSAPERTSSESSPPVRSTTQSNGGTPGPGAEGGFGRAGTPPFRFSRCPGTARKEDRPTPAEVDRAGPAGVGMPAQLRAFKLEAGSPKRRLSGMADGNDHDPHAPDKAACAATTGACESPVESPVQLCLTPGRTTPLRPLRHQSQPSQLISRPSPSSTTIRKT